MSKRVVFYPSYIEIYSVFQGDKNNPTSLITQHPRATPQKITWYKHCPLIYKIYNDKINSKDWMALIFPQSFNIRNSKISLFENTFYKILLPTG
jgi:hypothetical protein